MKICQAADEEGHFSFADLMLYAASLGTPEYEPYTGGVDKSVFLLNNCVYTGGSDTITKAQSLAAVDDSFSDFLQESKVVFTVAEVDYVSTCFCSLLHL